MLFVGLLFDFGIDSIESSPPLLLDSWAKDMPSIRIIAMSSEGSIAGLGGALTVHALPHPESLRFFLFGEYQAGTDGDRNSSQYLR